MLQTAATAILDRRGSNGGGISSSAPSKSLTKHPSPIRLSHKSGAFRSQQRTKSTADLQKCPGATPFHSATAQPVSPFLPNFNYGERPSPYGTSPESPPPQPRPRTRNSSSNLGKRKNAAQGKLHFII